MVLVMRRLTQSECQWVKVRVIYNFKVADDQQNWTVNSISLKIKPKYSNSLQSKPNINWDMNLKCLKTNECFVFKNTAVKTKSTLIVNSNESKRFNREIQSWNKSDSKSKCWIRKVEEKSTKEN